MDLSLTVVICAGLLANYLFQKLKLPGVAGMLLVGILAGPSVLNLISHSAIVVAADFRNLALAAILVRAIFELQRDALNKSIVPALLIATIPTLFEIVGIVPLAHFAFHLDWPEAGALGIILSGVSLSFLVPNIVKQRDHWKDEIKSPSIVLASVAFNNVIVIVIFTLYAGQYWSNKFPLVPILAGIPVAIILAIMLGFLSWYFFNRLSVKYESFLTPNRAMLLIFAFILVMLQIEDWLHNIIPVACLLGVLVMGLLILEKTEAKAHILSNTLKTPWVFCELLLFVLIGAQVDIQVIWNISLIGLGIIACGLIVRSCVVSFLAKGYTIDQKERAFYVACNLPKATVQAAIAAIPIELGLPGGEIILAISVLAIMSTTLLGALGMNFVANRTFSPLENSDRHVTNINDHIARIGRSIRSKKNGTVYRVCNGKNVSEKTGIRENGTKLVPGIELKLYQPPEGCSLGDGRYLTVTYTDKDSFEDEWEILPDDPENLH